jgi:hypothetical protein
MLFSSWIHGLSQFSVLGIVTTFIVAGMVMDYWNLCQEFKHNTSFSILRWETNVCCWNLCALCK